MVDLLYALTLVLLCWAVFFAICLGLGRTILKSLRAEALPVQYVVMAFWVGWASVIAFLQVWHIVFKVDGRAFALIALAGTINLVRDRRELMRDLSVFLRHRWALSLTLMAMSLALADQALRPMPDYDSGLYHLQVLRWTREYPLVPGLGNLHGRFAFNNASFLYVALVGIGPWRGIEYFLANGLLILVIAAHALISLDRVVREHSRWKIHQLFTALLLVPLLFYVLFAHETSSPSPNVAVDMVELALMVALIDFLSFDSFSEKRAVHQLWFVVLLASLGVVIKLSAIIFGFGAVLTGLGVWLVHNRREPRRVLTVLGGMSVLAGALILPWMIRGIVLSGYPAYPATLGAAPVSWRVPASQATEEAKLIRSWPRVPNQPPEQVLANWDWFSPWLKKEMRDVGFLIPAGLVALTALLAVIQCIVNRRALLEPGLMWLFLIPTTVALIGWFLSAPDLRFATALLWGTAIGGSIIVWSTYNRSSPGLLIVLTLAVLLSAVIAVPRTNVLVSAGPEHGFYPIPRTETKTFETASGLTINYPAQGDQCWNAALPCTPYYSPSLRLRDGGLRSGFEVSSAVR